MVTECKSTNIKYIHDIDECIPDGFPNHKTFNDFYQFGIECEKDFRHWHNLFTNATISGFPKWVLSAESPKEKVELLRMTERDLDPVPLVSFLYFNNEMNIVNLKDNICLLVSMSRSIYDENWAINLYENKIDGLLIRDVLIGALNPLFIS